MGHVSAGTNIIEAFKASGYPTAEECSDLRAKALAEDVGFDIESREKMLLATDELIAFLQANREHIGGLAVVAIPFHGDKVVEADRSATDGRDQITVASSDYKIMLYSFLRDRLERSSRSSNPLAQLFG